MGYAAGPAASLSEPVCCWPLSPIQVSETVVPGWYWCISVRSEAGEPTAWPFTAVITSPASAPALAAGALQNTPAISVPDWAGAMLCGTGFADSFTRQCPLELMPPALKPDCAIAWSWCSCCDGLPALLGPLLFGSLAIAMPRNAGWPIWIVLLPLPWAISNAIDLARLIGIEKPWLVPFAPMLWLFAAVFIAMTWPAAFASAPPESPSAIGAFVWNMPVSRSDEL